MMLCHFQKTKKEKFLLRQKFLVGGIRTTFSAAVMLFMFAKLPFSFSALYLFFLRVAECSHFFFGSEKSNGNQVHEFNVAQLGIALRDSVISRRIPRLNSHWGKMIFFSVTSAHNAGHFSLGWIFFSYFFFHKTFPQLTHCWPFDSNRFSHFSPCFAF